MCSNETFVFTCLYPGFMVYQWHAVNKKIENKLDCSKLLPCSESLKSIAIDEHLSLIKCQISALCTHGKELYIGTTWGCLIIAEINSLRPITVFRPYENEVSGFYFNINELFYFYIFFSFQIKTIIAVPNQNVPLIATIGRRYRSLISRYMDSVESSGKYVGTPTHPFEHLKQQLKNQPQDVDNHIHVLLWKAKNWT